MHFPFFKSFFALAIFSAILACVALILTARQQDSPSNSLVQHQEAGANLPAKQDTVIDLASWQQYTDNTHFISFKYPAGWKIQTYPDKGDYYIIVLSPDGDPKPADHIRIYISSKDYFELDGLPYKTGTLAGVPSLNLNDMLVGAKYAAHYYTFDMGTDLSLQPHFKALLQSVAFKQ